MRPSSGPIGGGTVVEVRGAHIALPDSRGLFCQFGGAEAVFTSSALDGKVVFWSPNEVSTAMANLGK